MNRHANLPNGVITINSDDTFNNGAVGVTDVSTLNDGVVIFVTPGGASLSAAQLLAASEFKIQKVQKNAAGTVIGFQENPLVVKKSLIKNIVLTPVSTGLNQVVNISTSSLSCNTEYLIKLQMSNPAFFVENGYNLQTKIYSLNSGCCAPCEGCGEGDCKEFWKEFRSMINADEDGILTAYLKDPEASAVDDDDLDDEAVDGLAEGVCPVLQLEISAPALRTFCGIPDVYSYPNFVTADVSLVAGFECVGTATTIQDACPVQIYGLDVAQEQFKAAGIHQGYPVRRSNRGAPLFAQETEAVDAVKTATYAAITFEMDSVTESGDGYFSNPTSFTIYVDSTLFDGGEPGTLLLAYLDTAFATGGTFAGATISADCSSRVVFTPN